MKESSDKVNADSIQFYFRIANTKRNSFEQRQENINKALVLAQSVEDDSILLKILYIKTSIHSRLGQYDSLHYFNKMLFDKATLNNDNYYLGKHYYLKGYYFNAIKKISDSAFYFYNRSKSFFAESHDSSQIGRRLLAMAQIQQNDGDYFGSKETITESLRFLLSEKDARYIASAYSVLATNHRKLFNYEDASKYYIEAIETASLEMDKLRYINNLATFYIDNQQYKDAIERLSLLKKDTLYNKIPLQRARGIDNLAYATWLKKKTNIKDELLTALHIRLENNDKRGQIASYTHLSEYFVEEDKKIAKQWINKAIKVAKEIKNPKGELDVLRLSMKVDPQNIGIKNRFIMLRDSLYKQELKVKTQFAKIKYDDQLEKEKILKLQRENILQETKVLKQKNQKLLFLSSSILLIFLIGFIIYFYRLRNKDLMQKNEIDKLKVSYAERIKFSKKIHDSFGSRIYGIMLSIKKGVQNNSILDQLEILYDQSRNFSRENNEIDTKDNYSEELYRMLDSYVSTNTKSYIIGLSSINWSKYPDLDKLEVYMVLQELMVNMDKYSQANLVVIAFREDENYLKIAYSDDGVGASANVLSHKNGLKNTESRIHAIHGTIIFDSEKNNGFKAEIQIPI